MPSFGYYLGHRLDAQVGLVRVGEYGLPGLPEAAIISESIVRRPDFDGKGFGITVWMTLKIAQLAPIPGVSASSAFREVLRWIRRIVSGSSLALIVQKCPVPG